MNSEVVFRLAVFIGFLWLARKIEDSTTDVGSRVVVGVNRLASRLEKVVRMSNQEVIDVFVAQLGKAKGEIVGKIADLQAQIDAGVPVEQLDLSGLAAAAQALDDIVPDPAPVTPDVPPVDVPVEPTPEV